jgi:hypothetical protein
MEGITSLQTSGSVGSRFVTQDELDDAKKAKEEEWKAAYDRSVLDQLRIAAML